MTNLSLPQKAQPMRVTNQPVKNKPEPKDGPRPTTAELVQQLDAELKAERPRREVINGLMAEIKARFAAEANAPAETPPPGTIYNQPPLNVSAGGDIQPGANVGSGSVVNNGGVAGGNITTNNIASGGSSVSIGPVTNLTLNTPGTAVNLTLPGAGKAKQMTLSSDEAESAEPAPLGEAEREYLARLMVTASRVPLGQLDFDTGGSGTMPEIKLDAIYIPLETTTTSPAVGGRPDERIPVAALRHVIDHRRVVILGDPGSGKSTFLNYLTWCLAGSRLYPERGNLARLNVEAVDGQRAANWRYGALLPVRVDLREFALDIPDGARNGARKGSAAMLWKHITRQLEEHHLADFARDLQSMLHEGQALVMLDGLDEVPDKAKRQIVKQAIDDFAVLEEKGKWGKV